MRHVVRAAALGASLFGTLAITGCNSSGGPDFVAKAPDEPIVPPPGAAKLSPREALDTRIAHHAKLYDIPESLIHAAVKRESGYNPGLKHGPFWGLMQIRYDTARGVGYKGPAKGLLDAETNLTYGAAYLANAYLVAGGDERRAIRLYSTGFYYEAKRKGLLRQMRTAEVSSDNPAKVSVAEAAK